MTESHVAVTGAGGYLGSRLLATLSERHPAWTLTALDNHYSGAVRSVGDVEIADGDVRDRDALEDALEGCDAVVHLAALSDVPTCESEPELAYETNVTGTNNVAWFCRKTETPLAFATSMAVLGDPVEFPIDADHPRDPMNWYGRTKLLSERAIETFAEGAFPAHQLLLANLYGSHEIDGRVVSKSTVVNIFLDRALDGDPLVVYEPGTQARNYVHVADVADAFADSVEALLAESATGSRTLPVGSDDVYSVRELAELVRETVEAERGIDVDIETEANPREETLVERFDVDTSATEAALGWSPDRTVAEAIRDAVAE